MYDKACVFCQIAQNNAPHKKVLETSSFLVIENKYPTAPVHVLVIDKLHRKKVDTISGKYAVEGYWDSLMDAVNLTITKLGLDKTGYKLVNNGAGYNHFEHEHMHILGGTEKEPGGST